MRCMRHLMVVAAATAIALSFARVGTATEHAAIGPAALPAETAPRVENLSPAAVKAGLEAGTILLVDVREPHEIAAERIAGAVVMPMSRFEPRLLPDPGERRLVFYCRSGNRSATAARLAQSAGLPYDAHLAGGILAWKATGLATERD